MACARLLAGCLILLVVLPATAAPRDNRHTRMPQRPVAAPMASPMTASSPQVAIGLCQCIADRSKRNISCLSSAEQCQSTCATAHYSFVPFAPSCPITAR